MDVLGSEVELFPDRSPVIRLERERNRNPEPFRERDGRGERTSGGGERASNDQAATRERHRSLETAAGRGDEELRTK
jgi:hypothetical protein